MRAPAIVLAACLSGVTGCHAIASHPTGFAPVNYTLATAGVGAAYWAWYAAFKNDGAVHFTNSDALELRRHAIFVGDHAHALDVGLERPETHLTSAAYSSYLDTMITELDRSEATEVLIYIHGGMNNLSEGPAKSWSLYKAMRDSGDTKRMFPIFVDWESGLQASYVQHLMHIRQGKYERSGLWMGIAPYVYSVDFISGLVRSPFPIGSAWINEFRANSTESVANGASWPGVHIDSGQFVPGNSLLHYPKEVLRFPFHTALAPVVDMFGSPAFENMTRRTSELFRQDPDATPTSLVPQDGALAILLERLETYLNGPGARRREPLKVVLIGHSMGAIAISRFLRESKLPISDVVFMASASTVRQFQQSVVPYLHEHANARFYNLTLNPTCEIRESHVLGLSPYGSLLVWLDDYLGRPETTEDKMIGRWTSLPSVLSRLDSTIAPRVTFKGFGYRDPTVLGAFGPDHSKPCQHGEFSDAESMFWRRDFWRTRELPQLGRVP